MITKKKSIKQCVILSGKGGTGKTCLSASLIHLSSKEIEGVYVDADVDAANLALVTHAISQEIHSFSGGLLATINQEICSQCGLCFEVCRYDAIQKPSRPEEHYQVIELLCDGCAACVHACPETAITMERQQDGEWYRSNTPYGNLFHAELFPGAENTGKLVTTVKQHAKLFGEEHLLTFMIVDGPPGIGCPVISASSGADLAVVAAEPGSSGIHDLERILKTLEHFKIPLLVCINKADIYPQGTQAIKTFTEARGYLVGGEIPFDTDFPIAMINGQPITQFSPECRASQEIGVLWEVIKNALNIGDEEMNG